MSWALAGGLLMAACGKGDDISTEGAAVQAAPPAQPEPPTATTGDAAGALLSRDLAGLVTTTGPLGTQVVLGDRFHSAAMARVNDDGSITTECFDDAADADAFLAEAVHGGTPTTVGGAVKEVK